MIQNTSGLWIKLASKHDTCPRRYGNVEANIRALTHG